MKDKLRQIGYVEVDTDEELTGKTYITDRHCYDVIFFPCDQRDFMESCSLVKDGYVVIQVNCHKYTIKHRLHHTPLGLTWKY